MKIWLTNDDFTPPLGTFEFGSTNSKKVKHCIQIGRKLNSFHNCIRDETFLTKLALRIDCPIPDAESTFTEEMIEKWDWNKNVGANLFENRLIYPSDRIIKADQDEDGNFVYTLCSFFGGPFAEDIAIYVFEA